MSNPATNQVRIPAHSQLLYRSGIAVNPSVPVGGMAPWRREAIQKAIGLTNLQPNWDSYGSHAPSRAVIQTAIHFLRNVAGENLPTPLVVPISGGGLHFEWTIDHRELEVAIDPKGSLEMLRVQDGMPIENDDVRGINEVFA